MTSSPGYVLRRLGVAVEDQIEQALEPLGLRPRHFRVLAFIHDGEHSQQDLAQLTGLDRTTMVAVVDTLERLGLARRQHSASDRRKHQVVLTGEGTAALREGMARLGKAERAFFGSLTEAERRQLGELTTRLLAAHDPSCRPSDDAAPDAQ